jgi:oligosaccharide repeat unit polymerase
MSNFLASPWIPTLVLLCVAAVARFFQRSWFAPSVFAPAIWFAYLFLPLAIAPEYRVSLLAVWLIVLLIGCMTIGSVLAETQAPKSSVHWTPGVVAGRLLRMSLVLSAISMAGAAYSAYGAITQYGLDGSLSGLLAVGHLLSVERYAGEQTPFLVRILVTWTFPAALLGGMSFAIASSRRARILCFMPLLPALAFSLVQAAKANTLIAIVLGISGYLAMRTVSSQRASTNRRAGLVTLVAALGAGLSFFFAVDTLRSHTQEQKDLEVQSDGGRAKSTAIGYLSVFSYWVDRPEGLDSFHLNFGQYTFGGLLQAVGLNKREVGIYTDMVTVGSDDSNIYTAFRGLVEDFTPIGAALVCVVAGYAGGKAYSRAGRRVIWDILILIGFYGFLVWSPIGSLFVYNGPILALIVAAIVLKGAERYAHRIGTQRMEAL